MNSSDLPPTGVCRRNVLRSAGVSLALPFFPSLRAVAGADSSAVPKKRMVCIGNMLGFHPDAFWPKQAASTDAGGMSETSDYRMGRTCKALESLSDSFSVLAGLDHGLSGGHFAIHAFLSGVHRTEARSMPMANVTIDQYAAEFIPGATRFPTLTIGSRDGIHGGCQMSWTRSGTRVPPIPGPLELFRKLFVGTSDENKDAEAYRFDMQGSILDTVRGNANDLKLQLNARDRDKLDEYLTSVRDVEQRIDLRRRWIDIPKPDAPIKQPVNRNMVEDLPLLYDLIILALQTDSTRIATLEIGGDFNPNDLGISGGYHSLSHHGQRQDRIELLVKIEQYQIEQFARFLSRMNETQDENGSLLEQTAVLFGSGIGNANSHTSANLPIILAGGGFRHGRLLAFDSKAAHRPPLTNLFVSMLQNFGAEVDQFATSTGTLRGLA